MFDIHSIYIKDFKSYNGKHKFTFPSESGLYFITGDNQFEPKLGSNGAGKSTLLDAIYWCLYGRTLRGLKSGDVVTWGKESCTVGLHLTIADVEYQITRTQNPNSITLTTAGAETIVDQTELQQQLPLGDEAFTYSVILPQFGQSFFELAPTAKLTLFSQIMGLDYWLERSQQAALETTVLGNKIGPLNQKIASTKEMIASVKTGLTNLIEKEVNFNKERTTAINELEREINENDLYIIDMNIGRKFAVKGLTEAEQKRVGKVKELKSMEAARNKYVERRESLNVLFSITETKLRATQIAYGGFNKLGVTCPTCLQTVNSKHLEAEKLRLMNEINDQKTDLANAKQRHTAADRFVSKINSDLSSLADDIVNIDKGAKSAEAILAKAEAEIATTKQSNATLRKQLGIENLKENPYSTLIADNKKIIKELKTKFEQDEAALEVINSKHEAVSYWVAGFKRLRLYLIEETLRALELEVNNSLASLGLIDWQVEFDIERENKSGGLTKGFVVFIRNAIHPEPVRFEAWSGGEGQRLQLAGDLGLANLIMMQAGLTNTIEFFDEPSKHLSQEGLLDLAETLHQRAINDGKRIFLIDHRTIDFGDFADIIQIVKTEEGSSFKEKGATR